MNHYAWVLGKQKANTHFIIKSKRMRSYGNVYTIDCAFTNTYSFLHLLFCVSLGCV